LIGILADANIRGQIDALVARMQADAWKPFWDHLQLSYSHFEDVGLALDSPDLLVWQTCQREELLLITDNRNRNVPDSLEMAILDLNTPTSLPVFTIASVPRLRKSRDYAERVIEKLFEALLQIDSLRGTGRLYLP
jgi:hypothetical protein